VTGGAGFIGSHIVDEMVKRGCETIVMDILSEKNFRNLERNRKNITLINGSITNEELVKNSVDVDVIFHEAAYNFGPSMQSPVDALMVNGKGTLNILESLKARSKDTVLIYGSTGSVYGKLLYSPQDEKHPCNPANPYAISKYVAERYIDFFVKQYGLKAVTLRYYNVVGRRQNIGSEGGLLSNFVIRVLKGEPPIVEGDGAQKRCFTGVEDIVNANVLACEVEKAYGSTFNIAGAEVVTIDELANLICSFSEKPLRPLHVEKSKGEEYDFEPSIDLAREVLGYVPSKRLIDVLPDLMEWIGEELDIKHRIRRVKQ
jgi:nucleoside-diphosphate-sugar epimerase